MNIDFLVDGERITEIELREDWRWGAEWLIVLALYLLISHDRSTYDVYYSIAQEPSSQAIVSGYQDSFVCLPA